MHQALPLGRGFLLFAALLSFAPFALAESKCRDESIAYQPQAATLKDAASTFASVSEHEISSCAVQAKIKVLENQSITILGYDIKSDFSKEIHYRLDNFKNGIGFRSDDCRVQMKTVVIGKPHWDSLKTIVSDPECVSMLQK